MLLHGQVGCGKTTFVASIPNSLIFDFENKATSVRFKKPGRLIMFRETYLDYAKVIEELLVDARAGSLPFRTIVFDPVTTLVNLVRTGLSIQYRQSGLLKGPRDIAAFGKDGAGWGDVNYVVADMFTKLHNAGYGWVATAHMLPVWRKTRDSTTLDWESVLNAGVLKFLYKDCEFSGSVKTETVFREVAQPNVTVGGKNIAVEPKRESATDYQLDFGTRLRSLPLRKHIPIPDRISIPEGRGWDKWSDVYSESVAKWNGSSST